MPKEVKERREEDNAIPLSWQAQVQQIAMLPSKDALPANSILPSALTTPMAELKVIGKSWKMIINHQIDKAKIYITTLPSEQQAAYQKKIDAFTDEATGFHLLSEDLIHNICLFSLSTLGTHHKDMQQLAQTVAQTAVDSHAAEP